ncbi:MAG TPA: hypothetical protein VGC30_01540 [Dokdonella sp.]
MRRSAAALFVALFALSQASIWAAYYAYGAKPLIGDERSYEDAALAILAGGAWMQSTIWPPLQPLLLAALHAAFGTGVLAAQLVQTALFVGCAALLRDLWRRLGGRVAAANAAAALFLLNPGIAAYAHWLWPEIPHLFLLLAALDLLARSPTRARALAAGACVGLAILAKSLLSPFWPAFLLVFVRRAPPRVLAGPALAFALGLGAATLPPLVHGWRAYGTPMIADSSIYNLWIGLTDRWRSDYVEDMGGRTLPAFLASAPTPRERNALYLAKIRAFVAERGVARVLADQLGRQYFRLFGAKTPLVSQLPGRACAGHLSVYRTPPWLTRALTAANDAFHALTLGTAAFGLAALPWFGAARRRAALAAPPPARGDEAAAPLRIVVALFLAYQLALFALVHVKARFLLPMLPFLCGFAGDVLAARGRGAPAAPAWPRFALGAALAALLLFLAFGGPALDRLCTG